MGTAEPYLDRTADHHLDLPDDPSADPPAAAPDGRSMLGALGERVAPVAMAHERTLPLRAELGTLFGERALVRGRVLASTGSAASSLALTLVAAAVEAGAWLAVVGVPTIGLDAASELGVCLDRIVAVDLGDRPAAVWPDVVAAAADGFELVLTRVPAGVRPAAARSVGNRLRQRGTVLVVLGDPGPLACDGVVESTDHGWEGMGDGAGHLRRRVLEVTAGGRRLPGARRRRLALCCPPSGHGPLLLAGVGDEPDEPAEPAGELGVAV